MENPSFENLRRFFERIKNVGFFERIFSWRAIASLGYDAFGEYQQLQKRMQEKDQQIVGLSGQVRDLTQARDFYQRQATRLEQDISTEKNRSLSLSDKIGEKERESATLSATLAETQTNTEQVILQLKEDLVNLKSKNEDLLRKNSERENEAGGLVVADEKNQQTIIQAKENLSGIQGRYDQLNSQYIETQKTLAEVRQREEERIREHDARVTELIALRKQLEDDRLKVQAERDAEIRAEFAAMEQTWKRHEEGVEQSLRSICQRHTIDYCDKEKFPYNGKPDNAVMILDQFVIFDAKSPKNPEELSNFPQYIKSQAEAAKKYLKGPDVRKEIFLVVPANTVEYIEEFHYDLVDMHVYVVTHDCLEPLILALRKIEEYEFAEKLSPEDRENICRVIGKFAHATKRRIQIDNYFSGEFIELLQSCDHLPDEIKQKVLEIELAEKMNPPIEKRKKKIPIKELEHDVKVIGKEAEAREIDVTAVTKDKIETITLNKFLE
jgi:hypothetical protein